MQPILQTTTEAGALGFAAATVVALVGLLGTLWRRNSRNNKGLTLEELDRCMDRVAGAVAHNGEKQSDKLDKVQQQLIRITTILEERLPRSLGGT